MVFIITVLQVYIIYLTDYCTRIYGHSVQRQLGIHTTIAS